MLRLDLFACDRATFERWGAALLARDAFTRGNLEIALADFASLPGLAPADLGLLAAALRDEPADRAIAGAEAVLAPTAPAVAPPDGALVASLRDDVVRLLGETPGVDAPAVVASWAGLADASHEVDDSASYLTAAAARSIAASCARACEEKLGVYVHAYVDRFAGR